eukprot:6212148-Pleurochrysis_carterae.AAC.3
MSKLCGVEHAQRTPNPACSSSVNSGALGRRRDAVAIARAKIGSYGDILINIVRFVFWLLSPSLRNIYTR